MEVNILNCRMKPPLTRTFFKQLSKLAY